MRLIRQIILTGVIIISAAEILQADIFYTPKQYNDLYNEKIACELELKSLREQSKNEKTNMLEKIRSLELQVEKLTRDLERAERQNSSDQLMYEARIAELEKMIRILKEKGSSREKELVEANRELQEKCDREIGELKSLFAKEREGLLKEMSELKDEYESRIASLKREIANLNQQLAELQELTEKQKKELSRMENQAEDLEKQLSDEIKKGEIRLKKYHDRIIINIDDRISFDSGHSELKKTFLPTLAKISKILSDYPEYYIVIEGHTDDVPIKTARFRNNWQLSTERALSVLDYLLENSRLDPRRFSATGYGEYRPIVPNDTKENRALNRRVDIVVIPIIRKQDK
mgnify:CR=1 FL=1